LRAWAAHHQSGGVAVREDPVDDAAAPAELATAPRDVFTAIDALEEQLERSGSSLGELEGLLDGPFGVRAMAALLPPAADPGLLRAEAWLYGQELVRMVRGVDVGTDQAAEVKRRRLEVLVEELARTLDVGAPKEDAVLAAKRFYRGGR